MTSAPCEVEYLRCKCELCVIIAPRMRWFLSGVSWGLVIFAAAFLLLACGRGPACVPPTHGGAIAPKPGNDAPASTTCPVQR